jgi:hypothetical protein
MAINTVKVWNDNYLPYRENFEDQDVRIEANRFVLMDREKAVKFLGTYAPVEKDAGGTQKPESFKKLRIELLGSTQELGQIKKTSCQACSFVGTDAKDLDKHINEFHLDQLIDKKEYEKRLKKG